MRIGEPDPRGVKMRRIRPHFTTKLEGLIPIS
jgi:hypothetical protein